MPSDSWIAKRDPLYRGDVKGGVRLPQPDANASIVRHVLYLDGPGRQTPYLSASEQRETAQRFAGADGRVYCTRVPEWQPQRVRHRARKEMDLLLRGQGKGDAAWPSAFEVMQARRYVEEHAEHLADFRELSGADEAELRRTVDALYDGN